MDQDATCYGVRPQRRPHCIIWGPSSPSPQKRSIAPIFSPCLLWPNGWITMPLGREVGLGQGDTVLDGDPAPPKRHSPRFSAHVCCGQTAGWIKMPLGTLVGLGQGDVVLGGNAAPPRKWAKQPPTFRPT